MRLIDANALIEAILEARWRETETVPKLIVLINNQPTEAWKGLTPTADAMEALEDLARNGSQSRFCKYEPKTGHWHITDAYPHNVYCSECYTRFAQTHWAVWEDGSLPRNYCPNCGAKMEIEDESD